VVEGAAAGGSDGGLAYASRNQGPTAVCDAVHLDLLVVVHLHKPAAVACQGFREGGVVEDGLDGRRHRLWGDRYDEGVAARLDEFVDPWEVRDDARGAARDRLPDAGGDASEEAVETQTSDAWNQSTMRW
jgi:hypothetical protein